MWRSNYQEDWERRKTYLIRSLFHDIPVLSPVPEDQESRYNATSPSDVLPSRPYSPLPPLIIEKMPNKHDHPKQFYQNLEKKMKKLYKKLFFNEESSSVEDLIEMYAGDDNPPAVLNDLEDYRNIDAGNASVSTIILDEYRPQSYKSFDEISPSRTAFDKTINKQPRGGSSPPNKIVRSSSLQESTDAQSSTQSIFQTQVTTVVQVHIEPASDDDETLRSRHSSSDQGDMTSPILECHRVGYNKTFTCTNVHKEESYNGVNDTDINEISGTDISSSAIQSGSVEIESDPSDSIETLHESIELMRKQKELSPSLGSLQNEPITTPSSNRSSSYKNIELQKNISFDQLEENSSDNQPNLRKTSSFSSASSNFNHILTTSTPKIVENSNRKSTSESSCKRVINESLDEDEISSIIITKRRKYENIAIQTSFVSESDGDNDLIDWNQLKKNFFVGLPRIYKLCPCHDHACRDE